MKPTARAGVRAPTRVSERKDLFILFLGIDIILFLGIDIEPDPRGWCDRQHCGSDARLVHFFGRLAFGPGN